VPSGRALHRSAPGIGRRGHGKSPARTVRHDFRAAAVPTGRGRTDILILCRDQKYIIETKIFTDLSYFEKGKRQLAAYLNIEGLAEGYYVVFSRKHSAEDVLEQEETVGGKRIFTRIIRVNFERPSRRKKRKKPNLRKA
jgi:hypothetical protein